MSTQTITARYVDPPKPGKRNGSVKTTDGTLFSIPPAVLSVFRAGGTYEVEYEDKIFNGHTFHMVTAAKETAAPSPSAAGATGGGTYQRETSEKDAERIFVCGIVMSYIKAGKIEPRADDLRKAVDVTRSVWRQTFGAAPNAVITTGVAPPKPDEMSDEIPWY